MYGVRIIDENSDRARRWQRVFGRPEVPVRSVIPEAFELPDGVAPCYLMDLERISAAQRELLIDQMAEQWNLPRHEVANDMRTLGCPIKAAGVRLVELWECPKCGQWRVDQDGLCYSCGGASPFDQSEGA